MEAQEWELFTSEIIKKDYKITLSDLSNSLANFTNVALTIKQMTNIFETYKVNKNIEDNPDELGQRLVNVKDLVSTRLGRKMKRVDDLIAIQQEKDQAEDDFKLKGLKQVSYDYLAEIMVQDSNRMARVWRSIKDNDVDSNGFLSVDELDNCFREHFAPELDGKSIVYFLR